MAVQVNFLAVLVAAIASFAIATVWYGVVFRKLWMRLTGVTDMKPAPMSMILPLIGSFIMAFVLDHAIAFGNAFMHTAGVSGGLQGGFWSWLGFIAPVTLMGVVYEKRSWALWVLDNGFWLVSLLAMGAILSSWV